MSHFVKRTNTPREGYNNNNNIVRNTEPHTRKICADDDEMWFEIRSRSNTIIVNYLYDDSFEKAVVSLIGYPPLIKGV